MILRSNSPVTFGEAFGFLRRKLHVYPQIHTLLHLRSLLHQLLRRPPAAPATSTYAGDLRFLSGDLLFLLITPFSWHIFTTSGTVLAIPAAARPSSNDPIAGRSPLKGWSFLFDVFFLALWSGRWVVVESMKTKEWDVGGGGFLIWWLGKVVVFSGKLRNGEAHISRQWKVWKKRNEKPKGFFGHFIFKS